MLVMGFVSETYAVFFDLSVTTYIEDCGQSSFGNLGTIEVSRNVQTWTRLEEYFLDNNCIGFEGVGGGRREVIAELLIVTKIALRDSEHFTKLVAQGFLLHFPGLLRSDLAQVVCSFDLRYAGSERSLGQFYAW